MVPDDQPRARTHMLLAVGVAGERWLVDAGFGGCTLTAPLRMDRRVPQRTPHGAFRLQRDGVQHTLQVQIGADWQSLYRFDLQPQQLCDYELVSWYLSHHPDSMFRRLLVAARPLAEGRLELRDNRLGLHRPDGSSDYQTLTSASALREVLETRFGLNLLGLGGLQLLLEEKAALPPM